MKKRLVAILAALGLGISIPIITAVPAWAAPCTGVPVTVNTTTTTTGGGDKFISQVAYQRCWNSATSKWFVELSWAKTIADYDGTVDCDWTFGIDKLRDNWNFWDDNYSFNLPYAEKNCENDGYFYIYHDLTSAERLQYAEHPGWNNGITEVIHNLPDNSWSHTGAYPT